MDFYESQQVLSQYLLFHYGSRDEILPYQFGSEEALDYAVNSVNIGLQNAGTENVARALDLGCSVGRSTFELANYAVEVVGIDYSQAFINAANQILSAGQLEYDYQVEGTITRRSVAMKPDCAQLADISFETGDAMDLRPDLGTFQIVHLANLIDRLTDPAACLRRLPQLVEPGGRMVIASPYSWLDEFTPRENWVGGTFVDDRPLHTLEGLERHLADFFALEFSADQPFLIRIHARRYEWSVAQISRWRRLAE